MRRQPERLVFVDETSVKTNMTPLRGRSLRGARLLADAPFGKWRTQTFIAGLRQDGIVAPWTIEGEMDSAAFEAYVRTQLASRVTRSKQRRVGTESVGTGGLWGGRDQAKKRKK